MNRRAVLLACETDPACGGFTGAGTGTGAGAAEAEHPATSTAASPARLAIVPADTLLRRIITLAFAPSAPMHR